MKLSSLKDRSATQRWQDTLNDLNVLTARYYRNNLNEFCEYFETDIEGLYELANEFEQSKDASVRQTLQDGFTKFAKYLTTERDSPIHVNTVPAYRKALNKFLTANALKKISKKTKTVEAMGVSVLTRALVRECVEYQATNLRNRALCLVAKDTGLRISDLAQLTVDDFHQGTIIRDPKSDGEFRVWNTPLISEKTGVKANVMMGPESVTAVKRYIAGRNTGAMFLTVQSQHGTEIGSPMNKFTISKCFRTITTPLRKRGLRVSAHSFRKFFFTSLAHIQIQSKLIAGKKLETTDAPYYEFDPQKYVENYEHLAVLDYGRVSQEDLEEILQENLEMRQRLIALEDAEREKNDAIAQTEMEQSPEGKKALADSREPESVEDLIARTKLILEQLEKKAKEVA